MSRLSLVPPVDPRLAEALTEVLGEPVRLGGDGVLETSASLEAVVAALDEVVVAGVRQRGRVRLEPSGVWDCLEGALRVRVEGVGAWLEAALGDVAMEGERGFYVLPDDGGFTVEDGVLTVWARRGLVRGPVARLLGAKHGRIPLAVRSVDEVPEVVLIGDGPLIVGPAEPTRDPTQEGLARDLAALGVRAGDVLMVHASMRMVGGRAEDVLGALEEVIGPEGTLLVLVCAEEGPFSEESPAWHDLGVFAEVARTRAGWWANAHPFCRMVGWGPDARALLEDPPLDAYYGPGSPLARLVERGGRVLRLGTDTNTTTLFHHAEYVADLPHARRVTQTVEVMTDAGPVTVRSEGLDDSHGIADWAGEDYFHDVLEHVRMRPACRRGRVGHASADLLDAREAVELAAAWMRANLA